MQQVLSARHGWHDLKDGLLFSCILRLATVDVSVGLLRRAL